MNKFRFRVSFLYLLLFIFLAASLVFLSVNSSTESIIGKAIFPNSLDQPIRQEEKSESINSPLTELEESEKERFFEFQDEEDELLKKSKPTKLAPLDLKKIYFFPELKPFNKPWLSPEKIGAKGFGVVTSLDYSKQNSGKLWIGTEGAGLFYSSNQGINWNKQITYPFNRVDSILLDPKSDTHLFATSFGNLLYESKDNGYTWKLNYNINLKGCSNLKNLGILTTLTYFNERNIFYSCGNDFAISKDDGLTWTKYNFFDKYSTTALFKKTYFVKIKSTGKGILGTWNDEIFTTNDGGQTWNKLTFPALSGLLNAYDISSDGQTILIAAFDDRDRTTTFLRSTNSGLNWQTIVPSAITTFAYRPSESPLSFTDTKFNEQIQDISFDETNPQNIQVFIYLYGLYKSKDTGSTFELKFNPENFFYLPAPMMIQNQNRINAPGSPYVFKTIIRGPSDLRLSPMIKQQDKIYLPSDQGLFVSLPDDTLKNLVNNLYLTDTAAVKVAPCRIYSGLWHRGYYWINQDGSIEGLEGEETGPEPGQNKGCTTEALPAYDGFLTEGSINNLDIASIMTLSKPLSIAGTGTYSGISASPRSILHSNLKYFDGWYYFNEEFNGPLHRFFRLKIETNKPLELQLIQIPENKPVSDFFLTQEAGKNKFYVLTSENSDHYLFSSTDLIHWTKTSLSLPPPSSGFITQTFSEEAFHLNLDKSSIPHLFVNSQQIILGNGYGLFVSNDYGRNWLTHFPYTRPSNLLRDDCGFLYVGLNPALTIPQADKLTGTFVSKVGQTSYLASSGIWISKDNGISWKIYNPSIQKSFITSLAFSTDKKYIYAGTEGEGIWKIPYSKPCP